MNCLFCSRPLPASTTKNRRFCSDAHKIAYYRAERKKTGQKIPAALEHLPLTTAAQLPEDEPETAVVPILGQPLPRSQNPPTPPDPRKNRPGALLDYSRRAPIDLAKPPYTVLTPDPRTGRPHEDINLDTPTAQLLKFYWP